MSKNYLSIELAGKNLGLKYNMGALEVIVEYNGLESFDVVVIKDLAINIYAGLVGNAMQKEEELRHTIEDVKKWIKVLDFDEARELTEKVNGCVIASYQQKSASTEGSEDTRGGALNVA